MIYYIYIFSAVLLFVCQFAIMKFYQKNVKDVLITSLFFVMVTSLISFIIFTIVGGFKFSLTSFYFALILASIMLICNVIGILVIRLGKVSVYSMFMMLGGMTLPFLYGTIFLGENVTPYKIIGLILMIVSLFLPMLDDRSGKIKNRPLYFILCFLAFLLNGGVSVVSKAHQISAETIPASNFVALYSLICGVYAVIIISILLIFKSKRKENFDNIKTCIKLKPIIFSILFSIVSNTGNFLLLLSASKIDASLQYPIVTGGTIVISALMGRLVFKERVEKFTIIGLILTFISTILFIF